MILLDGKKTSSDIKKEIKQKVSSLREANQRVPGLSVIIIGNNPASWSYVKSKAKACHSIGIKSEIIEFPDDVTESTVLSKIHELNHDNTIDGILVQQPLPKQIDNLKITLAIDPNKDVDGFHPKNLGLLSIGNLEECFVSCTPLGIIELMKRYQLETKGKHAVIIGRSNIVGKPLASLLIQKLEGMNFTVTICHSGTTNIQDFSKTADVLIAAIGKPNFVTKDMIKNNAVVIDVGINRIADKKTKSGYKLVGDVHFESVSKICSAITPVPGGVGPMTIAMLLSNTLKSYERKN